MRKFLSPILALSLLAAPVLAGTALADPDVTVDTGKSSARGQGDVDVDVGRGGVDVDVRKDDDRLLRRDDGDAKIDADGDADVRIDVPGADVNVE